jgi:hypothetical protein
MQKWRSFINNLRFEETTQTPHSATPNLRQHTLQNKNLDSQSKSTGVKIFQLIVLLFWLKEKVPSPGSIHQDCT